MKRHVCMCSFKVVEAIISERDIPTVQEGHCWGRLSPPCKGLKANMENGKSIVDSLVDILLGALKDKGKGKCKSRNRREEVGGRKCAH